MKFSQILVASASAATVFAVPAGHEDHHHRRDNSVQVTQYVDQNGNSLPQSGSQTQGPAVSSVVTTVGASATGMQGNSKGPQTTLAPSGGGSSSSSSASSGSGTNAEASADSSASSGSGTNAEASADSSASSGSGSGSDSSSSSSSGSGSGSSSGSSASASSSGSSSSSGSQSSSSSSSSPSSSGSSGGGSFQDGTISCSGFGISKFDGVVSLDWVNKGGWASVMDQDGNTANSCEDGYYCSYACSAGMSKTQWPSNQPSDGKSMGGLLCKNGKLHRTNTDTSNLCESDQNGSSAENHKGQDIAMCRTDYPGSEDMVIPTVVGAGSSQPLSVVKEDSYYQWKGKKTSTQYYVNNAGVSKEDGCVWSNSGSGKGNWAPLVVGSGYTNGITYLSIMPNPNNKDSPNFNVKIVGDNVDGSCKYEDGKFSGSNSDGCTAAVRSGSAKIVFY